MSGSGGFETMRECEGGGGHEEGEDDEGDDEDEESEDDREGEEDEEGDIMVHGYDVRTTRTKYRARDLIAGVLQDPAPLPQQD